MKKQNNYEQLSIEGLIEIDRPCKCNRNVKVDITKTEYPVVRQVVQLMGWSTWRKQIDQIFVFWKDTYIAEQEIRRLLPYQRVNRFPGSFQLGKKSNLSINLNRLRKLLPQEFSFFPRTWVIPKQIQDFRKYQNKHKKQFYIIKPQASSQGKGIAILAKALQFQPVQSMVIQEYIHSPLLIDGLKFDFRLYVLLKSVDPLKVYLYKEGLARLATTTYKQPLKDNLTDLTMHLTNYAINKKSPSFVFNSNAKIDNLGHKRSFSSVLNYLKEQGLNITELMKKIQSIIIKTFIAALPSLQASYRNNSMNKPDLCFQIFGFDIILDDKQEPFLLQVNHTPSFTTDTPLDFQIKKNLIFDTLRLLNISADSKKNYFEQKPQNRKKVKLPWTGGEQGGYFRIYPSKKSYISMINASQDSWAKQNGLTRPNSQKHTQKINFPRTKFRFRNIQHYRHRLNKSDQKQEDSVNPDQQDNDINLLKTQLALTDFFKKKYENKLLNQFWQSQNMIAFNRPKFSSFFQYKGKIQPQNTVRQQDKKNITQNSHFRHLKDIRYIKHLRDLNTKILASPETSPMELEIMGNNMVIRQGLRGVKPCIKT